MLTTCARDHYTWANHYPAGIELDGPVTVRRFPVVKDTPGEIRHRVEVQLQQGIEPGIVDQERWMNDSLRVPELYHHLLDHAEEYRAVICAPYLFWTTFACAQVAPERTVLIPCLHDEPYARLELFQPMFTGVAGVQFLTEPEAALAEDLVVGPRTAVVGAGVDVPERLRPRGLPGEARGHGPLRAGRRAARGRQGLGRVDGGLSPRGAPRPRPVARDLRRGRGRRAARHRRPRHRPGVPRRRRPDRRLRGGRRLPAAVGHGELLAHDHGVVAGRAPR